MNRDNFDFLYKMFPHQNLNDLNIIIVNQTSKEFILESTFESVNVLNSFETGLSISRNLALQNATSDWCLIADDDLIYTNDFDKKIALGIEHFNNSGIIVFQAQIEDNKLLREYPNQSKNNLSTFEKLEVASFEMLINRKEINNRVAFNKFFGLGSRTFNSGEEQIFMSDVHKKLNLMISYRPSIIVQHPWLSTGREFDKKNRYFTKGAIFKKMYPKNYLKWILIQLFFDVKQNHIKFTNIYTNYKEALKGFEKLQELENE